MPVTSAPTQKMNGLPVTAISRTAGECASISSIAAFRLARPAGPSEVDLLTEIRDELRKRNT